MIPPHRHIANPDFLSVGYHEGRGIRTHVDHNRIIVTRLTRFALAVSQSVIAQEIIERQRGDLDQFDFDLPFHKRLQVMLDLLTLHRK